jgi:hypothetical protein
VSPRLVRCCGPFNFRFELSYVKFVIFNCRIFEMLKITFYGSRQIHVIVNDTCMPDL